MAGSEAEGLYGFLRGAMSQSSVPPPPKRWCQTPTATVSKLPHQESEGVEPKPSAPAAEGSRLAQEPPLGCLPSLGGSHPCPYNTPLPKCGSIKRVYKCQVEGCIEGPSTSQAAIYAHVCRDHLGVRLACPSSTKTFLNSDALRHHKKIHSSESQ